MLQDRYDCPLSTNSVAARDAYVDGLDRHLASDVGAREAFDCAIAADPEFSLAHLAQAVEHRSAGRVPEMKASLAKARATSVGQTERERSLLACLGPLIEGKGDAAFPALLAHLVTFPRDVLAVEPCAGVFGLIGFSGRPGREAENLAFATRLAPHYGDDWWFQAVLAFAQMEAGQLAPAERAIHTAMKGNPRNAEAAHIKAHLHYENGERDAGLNFLNEWRAGYHRDGALHCHIAWHVALWALDAGDTDRMWAVLNADISPDATTSPAINVLTDMAALLYRAELAGVPVEKDRWQKVSAFALKSFPDPGIAFVDVHAALAHGMAGNGAALDRVLAHKDGPAHDIVSRLAEAFRAFAAENWAEALAQLTPAMADHARIGGSRAQRDMIEFATAGCLLRLGKSDEAARLLAMRRPNSPYAPLVDGIRPA